MQKSTENQDKIIKLHNRYHSDIYLEQRDEHTYVLKGDLEYMRVGYSNKEMTEIAFVDPAGGPFLHVGYPIREIDKIIKDIQVKNKEFIIEVQ